jgi:hypothetical protein
MTDLFESSDVIEDDAIETTIEPNEDRIAEESFESGLNQSLGIEPVVKDEAPAPEPVVKQEEVKALFAGFTEDEVKIAFGKAQQFDDLNNRLTKTHDTAFGKIGQLEQTIKELKTAKENAPVATPLTKESFKALAEYLDDDDMATALALDLSSLQLGGSQAEAVQVDYDAINAGLEERFLAMSESFSLQATATKKEFETKLLTIQHPDWEKVNASEEFSTWKATLKQEARDTLNTTWDGGVLGQAFTSFKTWQSKKTEVASKKQQRLEESLLPSGSAGRIQAPSDDDFNQGLKQVLKNR